jgi:hypothetical protein
VDGNAARVRPLASASARATAHLTAQRNAVVVVCDVKRLDVTADARLLGNVVRAVHAALRAQRSAR